MIEQRFSVTSMLRRVLREQRAGAADVPCGSCAACCSGYDVELTEEEKGDARLRQDGGVLMRDESDTCTHLVGGQCEVYEFRPAACRKFDCRVMALTGVIPAPREGREHNPVADAVERMTPTCKTKEDREVGAALVLAAIVARRSIPEERARAEDVARTAVGSHEPFMRLVRPLSVEWPQLTPENQVFWGEAIRQIADRLIPLSPSAPAGEPALPSAPS